MSLVFGRPNWHFDENGWDVDREGYPAKNQISKICSRYPEVYSENFG